MSGRDRGIVLENNVNILGDGAEYVGCRRKILACNEYDFGICRNYTAGWPMSCPQPPASAMSALMAATLAAVVAFCTNPARLAQAS
jgi:hypothetical protein